MAEFSFPKGLWRDIETMQIRFLSSIDGVAKNAFRIPLAKFWQKYRSRLAGKVFNDEIRLLINRWLWLKGAENSRKHVKTCSSRCSDSFNSRSHPIEFRFVHLLDIEYLHVVYSIATCSKTVKVNSMLFVFFVRGECYDDGLSNSCWTRILQTFTCTAFEAESRSHHFNSNYCSDGER